MSHKLERSQPVTITDFEALEASRIPRDDVNLLDSIADRLRKLRELEAKQDQLIDAMLNEKSLYLKFNNIDINPLNTISLSPDYYRDGFLAQVSAQMKIDFNIELDKITSILYNRTNANVAPVGKVYALKIQLPYWNLIKVERKRYEFRNRTDLNVGDTIVFIDAETNEVLGNATIAAKEVIKKERVDQFVAGRWGECYNEILKDDPVWRAGEEWQSLTNCYLTQKFYDDYVAKHDKAQTFAIYKITNIGVFNHDL